MPNQLSTNYGANVYSAKHCENYCNFVKLIGFLKDYNNFVKEMY